MNSFNNLVYLYPKREVKTCLLSFFKFKLVDMSELTLSGSTLIEGIIINDMIKIHIICQCSA